MKRYGVRVACDKNIAVMCIEENYSGDYIKYDDYMDHNDNMRRIVKELENKLKDFNYRRPESSKEDSSGLVPARNIVIEETNYCGMPCCIISEITKKERDVLVECPNDAKAIIESLNRLIERSPANRQLTTF